MSNNSNNKNKSIKFLKAAATTLWVVAFSHLASQSVWAAALQERQATGVVRQFDSTQREMPKHSDSVAAEQSTASEESTATEEVLLIDNFESPIRNQVGGDRNSFQKDPSGASFARVQEIQGQANDRGYALRLTGEKKSTGWCGAWVHLFDHEDNVENWLDASEFDYLSIWIKGETGSEEIAIKVADKFWYELEDSWVVGRTSNLLPHGITTEWQELRIPVAKMRRIKPENLATVVFEFEKQGKQTIYIDDISFRTESGLAEKLPQKKYQRTSISELPSKSLWVWRTDELISNSMNRQRLFEFCNAHDIQSIWLQMLYKVETSNGMRKASIRFPQKFRRLNSEANAFGIEVHVLDGYPEYALHEWQSIPKTLVEAVCRFNRQANGNERFAGIHFDNEPHLLVGWHSPKHRQQILREFLELNLKCQQQVTEAGQLQFGIDIPFWWEEKDPLTGKPCGEVTFRGTTKPASFHCIDWLDNVGVMNYRNSADGADGMIVHGHDLLAYAEKQGRCEIFMGVETFAYPFQTVEFLFGLPREKFYKALDGPASKLGRLSRVRNYRIRVFDDGSHIHVGLEHPEDPHKLNRPDFDLAKKFIADQLAVQSLEQGAVDWRRFADALKQSGEYKDVKYAPFHAGRVSYHGLHVTAFMSPKITFAGQSLPEFNRQTRLATDYFIQFHQFRGIAVHCYDTFRELVGRTVEAR